MSNESLNTFAMLDLTNPPNLTGLTTKPYLSKPIKLKSVTRRDLRISGQSNKDDVASQSNTKSAVKMSI